MGSAVSADFWLQSFFRVTDSGLIPRRRKSALMMFSFFADSSPRILTPRLSVPTQTKVLFCSPGGSLGLAGLLPLAAVAVAMFFSPS